MKIVLDSNIFVSSFYWQGNPRKVFDRITNGFDESYITDEILKEISEVMLSEKFDTNKCEIEEYIEIIESYSVKVFPKNGIEEISRDKDDDKILQCGLEGNVDFIITGDKDLLILKEYKNIKIIKPKDYLENRVVQKLQFLNNNRLKTAKCGAFCKTCSITNRVIEQVQYIKSASCA